MQLQHWAFETAGMQHDYVVGDSAACKTQTTWSAVLSADISGLGAAASLMVCLLVAIILACCAERAAAWYNHSLDWQHPSRLPAFAHA
jgi:hypothetical protein